MAIITDKTVKSKYQPKQTNVTWVDVSGETPIEKHFINGQWVAVSGGGGTVDPYPTEDSTNPVQSGGVYEALNTLIPRSSLFGGFITDAATPNPDDSRIYFLTLLYGELPNFEIYNLPNNGKWKIIKWNPRDAEWDWETIDSYTSDVIDYILDFKADKVSVASSLPASGGILPNVFYNLGTLDSAITITLATPTDNMIENEYKVQFTQPSTAVTITLPNDWTWLKGSTPTFSASKTYQISIVNNLAICAEF